MLDKQRTLTDFAQDLTTIFAGLFFITAITIIVYWISSYSLTIDFTSYYLTIYTVWQGGDPYHGGLTDHLISLNPMLSPNLNPPITLLLGTPLHYLPYPLAFLVFIGLSFLLGLIAAKIARHYFFEQSTPARTRQFAVLIYIVTFPVLLSMLTGQFGAILFFFLMVGYHGYRQNRLPLVIGAWALAISMKFFAGLILLFCLQQRRFSLAIAIVVSVILISLSPALLFGLKLYDNYFQLLQSIYWYDASWNASLFGYLNRIVGCIPLLKSAPLSSTVIWWLTGVITIVWYGTNQALRNNQALSFALCLVLMITLSPLGWIYYFAILMPALLLCYESSLGRPMREMIWLGGLLLVTFPIGYLRLQDMPSCFYRLSLYSLQFYGLVLLISQLLWNHKRPILKGGTVGHLLFWPILMMLLIGLIFLFFIAQIRIT